jgi:hypothetical protein
MSRKDAILVLLEKYIIIKYHPLKLTMPFRAINFLLKKIKKPY